MSAGKIWPPTRVFSSSCRNMATLLMRRNCGEHGLTIARQLGFAHALNAGKLRKPDRALGRNLAQRRIVEDYVGRDAGLGRDRLARRPQRLEQGIMRKFLAAS